MVQIPDELAAEVLRYLVLGLKDHVRRNGGVVSAACQRLLYQLHQAATGGTFVNESSCGESGTLSIEGTGMPVPEAAGQLGCSEQHVRELARSGRIAARKVGRVWLVDPDSYRKGRA